MRESQATLEFFQLTKGCLCYSDFQQSTWLKPLLVGISLTIRAILWCTGKIPM